MTRFAKAMDRKGLKPDDLAYRSGLSLGYIYKLRRGEATPSMKTASELANMLGETIEIFLNRDCPERTRGVHESA